MAPCSVEGSIKETYVKTEVRGGWILNELLSLMPK